MTTAIAILDDYQNVALEMADWSVLPADVAITVFDDHEADVTRLAERLADFDVVAIMRERTPFPRDLIERLPHLRLLVTTGGRNASIDLAAAAEHGVTVCGTGAGAGATAELTWGLILSLFRRIHDNQAVLRAGGWQDHIGLDLAGKTLGILGLGRLGAQVARVGVAFGMEVLAWSQNLDDARAAACGARRVELEALLAAADVVTIHLVLSERTRGLIGAGELARMGNHAYLVNTSRGPIVDEAALIRALESGAIAGAALDVYDTEPLPAGHPLRRTPNLLLSPHVGYVTRETYEIFYAHTVEAIAAFLAGTPSRVIAQPESA